MIKRQQFFYLIRVLLSVGYYLLIAFPLVVSAAQVTLQWDATTPAPDGYNLYQRISGQAYNYSSPVNPAAITSTGYTVEGLQDGVTYFFVVRAFIGSQESGDSNEVEFTAPTASVDTDNDGYPDAVDAFPNNPNEWLDTDGDGTGNNTDLDDDGDGMPDAWETLYGLNPLVNDAAGDLDGDGITNLNEYNSGTDPSQVPGNTPPDQPLLAEPADGAAGVELAPTLITEAFMDADNDAHARTRYQIALGPDWDTMDSTDYVFDGMFSQYLTSLPLQELMLDPETTYYWRVKFYDQRNGESEWSATYHFTTIDSASAGYPDDDGDGILNEQEVAPDSINPDLGATQQMLVIGSDDTANPQLALLHSSSSDLVSIRTTNTGSVEIGSSANRPDIMTGLVSFKLRLLDNETAASVTIYLSSPAPADAVWYKYNLEEGWVAYPNATFSDDRKSVTIQLVDGGSGDDDGVQNGVIVDPSGIGYSSASGSLGYSSQTSSVSATSDSSGAGCFIGISSDGGRGLGGIFCWMGLFGLLAAMLPGLYMRR